MFSNVLIWRGSDGINCMRGVVFCVGTLLGAGIHKAIHRVSPKHVDRIAAGTVGIHDAWPLLGMVLKHG